MPLHHGGRLNERESGLPAGPESTQPDPDEPVAVLEAWLPFLPLVDCQLMTEREVFEREIALGLQRAEGAAKHCSEDIPHSLASLR